MTPRWRGAVGTVGHPAQETHLRRERRTSVQTRKERMQSKSIPEHFTGHIGRSTVNEAVEALARAKAEGVTVGLSANTHEKDAPPIERSSLQGDARRVVGALLLSGKPVDAELIHVHMAVPGDTPAERAAVSALAATGIIDREAFLKVTTDPSFGGANASLVQRIAFALTVKEKGGAELLGRYRDACPSLGKGVGPLAGLVASLRPYPGDNQFCRLKLCEAEALLSEAKSGDLLDGRMFAEKIKAGLPADVKPVLSGRGGYVCQAAIRAGADEGLAVSLGVCARRCELDATTFVALAHPLGRPTIKLGPRQEISLGTVSLDEAMAIAGYVAQGELTFAQLASAFIASKGETPPKIEEVVAAIKLANYERTRPGEVASVKALSQYMPPELVARMTKLFTTYSDEPPVTAHFLRLMTPSRVVMFVENPGLQKAFARNFSKALENALPSEKKMFWKEFTDWGPFSLPFLDRLPGWKQAWLDRIIQAASVEAGRASLVDVGIVRP